MEAQRLVAGVEYRMEVIDDNALGGKVLGELVKGTAVVGDGMAVHQMLLAGSRRSDGSRLLPG